ncbi:MAG: hypothetical protein GY754_15285 [bacterium]|nr:hypothetical protein [bacterium]
MKKSMKKSISSLIVTLLTTILSLSGCGDGFDNSNPDDTLKEAEWTGTQQGGTDKDEISYATAIDSKGNIYIAGNTGGDLDGQTNAGDLDALLIKYKPTGEKEWTRLLGTGEEDSSRNIAIGSDDTIYVSGWTRGLLDGTSNPGGIDTFLTAFNSSGDNLRTRQFGSSADDEPLAMTIDKDNNVYISGRTEGVLEGSTNPGGYDIFLVKYNSQGTMEWIKQRGSSSDENAYGLAIDNDGFVYITGYTGADLDGQTNAQSGKYDIFLMMYTATGTHLQTRLYGSAENDQAYGIAIDSSNNIYIAGKTNGYFDSDGGGSNAGNYDSIVMKLNSDKDIVWIDQTGSEQNDYPWAIAIDSKENIYTTGHTLNSMGTDYDVFLLTYDTSGNMQLVSQAGSTGRDTVYSMAIDNFDNVYISGHTNGSLAGNTNSGGYDYFLMKFYAE